MQTKVPITQKISIVLAAICYILTIYSFFTQTTLVVLIFFILHSVFTLYSVYMAFLTRADTSEFQAMMEEIEILTKEKKDIQKGLTERLRQKEEELRLIKEDLEKTESERTTSVKRNRKLKAAYNNLTKEHQELRNHNLLPSLYDPEEKDTIDIIETARTVIAQMREYATGAKLTVSISSVVDRLMIKADKNRIEVMFKNIIDNSIKYANRAGNLIITISTIGDDIFIVLKDNGEGLSEDETVHIFELNYQGSNRISGNGLGLAQAKAIVEYYGGTIYAKSNPGRGMGVYIQLPSLAAPEGLPMPVKEPVIVG